MGKMQDNQNVNNIQLTDNKLKYITKAVLVYGYYKSYGPFVDDIAMLLLGKF